jgi:hypothetical protein
MEENVDVISPEDVVKLSEEEQEQLKEIIAQEEAEENSGAKPRATKREMLKYVTQAARDGLVSVAEKNRLRQELGIFQSDFTRKKTKNNARKNKRKAQKKARRKNR